MNLIYRYAAMLILPMALLLWLQWPLRELVGAFTQQANDGGQIVFALYVAVAIPAASRGRRHLAAGMPGKPIAWAGCRKRLVEWVCVVPWALFMLWKLGPVVIDSISMREHFPESFNPGYFWIRLAVLVLPAAVFIQASIDVWRNPEATE